MAQTERVNIRDIFEKSLPEPEWLIPDLLVKGSLNMLAGMPGVGKSYFSYYLSIALASGTPFLGRPTVASPVLYVDEENSPSDLFFYLRWAWEGLGKPSLDLLEKNLNILHFQLARNPTQWHLALWEQIKEVQPVLTTVDTVTPACQIKDENDNGEANTTAQKLRFCQHASPHSAMLLLKHLREGSKGQVDVRGAKFWKGTCDSILYHKRHKGHPRKDGLSKTVIEPEKKRAFGLSHSIEIDPERLPSGAIILKSNPKPL